MMTLLRRVSGELLHKDIRQNNLSELQRRLGGGKKPSKKVRTALMAEDSRGRRPLTLAVQLNVYAFVETILSAYHDQNVDVNSPDSLGNTPAHAVCAQDLPDERIVTLVLSYPGLDLWRRNSQGDTPLLVFCRCSGSPLCERVITRFFTPPAGGPGGGGRNAAGRSTLHMACLNPRIRLLLVRCLLEHGEDPNVGDNDGETPLHLAARLGRRDLTFALLRAGADPFAREGRGGRTPAELTDDPGIRSAIGRVSEMAEWLRRVSPELAGRRWLARFSEQGVSIDNVQFLSETILEDLEITDPDLRGRLLQAAVDRAKVVGAQQAQRAGMEEEGISRPLLEAHTPPVSRMTRLSLGKTTKDSRTAIERPPLRRTLTSRQRWQIDFRDVELLEIFKPGQRREEDGFVYRALYMRQRVAVKLLPSSGSVLASTEGRFREDVEMLMSLRSPNVTEFYGLCVLPSIPGSLVILREFCARGSLRNVLCSRSETVTWARVFGWCTHIVRGLIYLHSLSPQVVHGDLNADNVLITEDSVAKISNFGIAKFLRLRETSAPELHRLPSFLCDRTDVFGFGVILWELVNRCVSGVWMEPSPACWPPKCLLHSRDACCLASAAVLERLSELYERCTRGEPSDRPCSRTLLDALQGIRSESGEGAVPSPSPSFCTRMGCSACTTPASAAAELPRPTTPVPAAAPAARADAPAAAPAAPSPARKPIQRTPKRLGPQGVIPMPV